MTISQDPINNLENLIAKNKTSSLSIYLMVVVSLIAFLALLPVITIDISSQSRGIIRSKTDNVPVSVMVNGEIVYINLRNNTTIQKGDTLVKIEKEELEVDKMVQDSLQNTISILLKDVTNLLQNKTNIINTSTAHQDFYKYLSKKTELQSKVAQAQTNYNRYKILFDKDIIARAEYEKHLYELRFATQALNSFVNQQKANWETQKRDLEERLKSINGNVKKLDHEQSHFVVLAPTSGTIENFSGLQIGSIVTAGKPIATISPEDNLIVESTVLPNDIGLIKKNQKVKFQIDAFNYNQWGLLEGKVTDIDKNITLQDNQAFFKVRCSINSKIMQLKSGYQTKVSKGMTLTTRYHITRRSLFDLLFDKVDNWLNPKQLVTSN